MFEKLKARFFPKSEPIPVVEVKKKPVLITIHGYGRRRKHEMDNLFLWDQVHDFEMVQFDMYDLFDEHDCDWMKWVERAKKVVDHYIQADREVYLLGFSMGGVIASYLAAIQPSVKKLILIAPAFNYLHVDTITSVITKGAQSLFTSDRDKKSDIEVPRSFYNAFVDVVKHLKKYIHEVSCPVLLLHGDEDEVIPVRSSTWAFDKIPHTQKKLIILHGGHHRLLTDEAVNWECYQLIRLCLEDKILHDQSIPQAPDILDQYRKELLATSNQNTEEALESKENCECIS